MDTDFTYGLGKLDGYRGYRIMPRPGWSEAETEAYLDGYRAGSAWRADTV